MVLAIMQPYIFPYIGYWQLIYNSDEFIFFDVVQYNKRSWMNRNRILHPDIDNTQYISVPVRKHQSGTLICDILVNNDEKWKSKILGQLTVYKKLNAPFYDNVLLLIQKIFNKDYCTLLELSIESTKVICRYLDIDLKYRIASEVTFNRNIIEDSGDWALSISKALNAKKYINPYSGYQLFDEKKFNKYNIEIKFLKSNLIQYKQSKRKTCLSELSIIDLLMFNSKEDLKKIIKEDYKEYTSEELEEKLLIK